MALFLTPEQMWDMPLGGMSKEKQIPHWFGNIAWAVVALIFKILFRYKAIHRERLRGFKNHRGVVVVANHTSFLDVILIYLAARPPQWVRFMARDTLFDNGRGILGQIISRCGAFPVTRDSADRMAIRRASHMLKDGEVVVILPEGTRRNKGDIVPEIHSGAALVARMGKAPILPMTVRNAENVKKKGERMHFPKITVEYGNPLLLEDFNFLPKDERLEGCSWYAMRECFALSLEIPPDQVDMKALFPDGKDYSAIFAEHPIPSHTTEEVCAGFGETNEETNS